MWDWITPHVQEVIINIFVAPTKDLLEVLDLPFGHRHQVLQVHPK